jgi:hypothetical protein
MRISTTAPLQFVTLCILNFFFFSKETKGKRMFYFPHTVKREFQSNLEKLFVSKNSTFSLSELQ